MIDLNSFCDTLFKAPLHSIVNVVIATTDFKVEWPKPDARDSVWILYCPKIHADATCYPINLQHFNFIVTYSDEEYHLVRNLADFGDNPLPGIELIVKKLLDSGVTSDRIRLTAMKELTLRQLSKMRTKYNIPGIKFPDVLRFTDKSESKKHMVQKGFPETQLTPWFLYYKESEAHREPFPFPWILKPCRSSFCRNVNVVHNYAEYLEVVGALKEVKLIVESFVAVEKEYETTVVVRSGKILFNPLVVIYDPVYQLQTLGRPIEVSRTAEFDSEVYKTQVGLMKLVFGALSPIPDCLFSVQFLLEKGSGRFLYVENSIRVCGFSCELLLHSQGLYAELVVIELGEPEQKDKIRRSMVPLPVSSVCCYVFQVPRRVLKERIEFSTKFRSTCRVIEWFVTVGTEMTGSRGIRSPPMIRLCLAGSTADIEHDYCWIQNSSAVDYCCLE